MAKGILEFDLNVSEDIAAFEMAQKAPEYLSCLEQIRNKIRSILKYEEKPFTLGDFSEYLRVETDFYELTD